MNPARSQTFGYDALSRLTSASGAYGDLAYQYDSVGNRTQLDNSGTITPYTYATDSNRLDTLDGQSVPFDATGNILQLNGHQFSYSDRNRLATTGDGGSTTASYQYNADGERVRKVTGGTDTNFAYDQRGHLIGEYANSGTSIREYIYLNGQPLSLALSGALYYYHNGRLDSPQKLSDGSKAVVWDSVRTPFGVTTLQTNTIANPLRLSGQYADGESGLYQNGYRDYDPELGRYAESDPVGLASGLNTYGYVKQNPLKYTDPSGLCFEDLCIGEGAVVYTAGQAIVDALAVGLGTASAINGGDDDNVVSGPWPDSSPFEDVDDATGQCSDDDLDKKHKNCLDLYRATLRACASIKNRRAQQRCQEAAKGNYEECMSQD